MNEETKTKLKAAGLESVITEYEKAQTDLKAEQDGRAADKAAHVTAIAEKDAVISQKTNDIVQARKEYQTKSKSLADMTEEEKKLLSETELELKQRMETFEAEQATFREEQAAARAKDIAERRGEVFKSFVGTDAELTKKLEGEFALIKDSDKAETVEEIKALAQKAFNMLAIPAGDPVIAAIQQSGGEAPGARDAAGFADSAEGKSLAEGMGLVVEPPPAATT